MISFPSRLIRSIIDPFNSFVPGPGITLTSLKCRIASPSMAYH